ncbi:MAG TPA: hypothetical protein VK569_03385 [Bacteroidota bacterium]|nr:hypothetical protein [Bacteroidota bacterium]
MTPAIGIGFISLTGLLFVAYIFFLIDQHKLQDELARHCKEEGDDHRHPDERLNPLIEVWICQQCGFMSTLQSFCIHCSSPRPQETRYLRVALREYVEQPGHTLPGAPEDEDRRSSLVARNSERREAHAG